MTPTNRSWWTHLICLTFLIYCCALSLARAADDTVLARVEMSAAVPVSGLAVHALLQDANGRDYAVVIAPATTLHSSGFAYLILATNAVPQTFVIARTRRPVTHARLAHLSECVYDDGRHVILRRTAAFIARRADYAAIVRPLPQTPLRWDAPARAARRATAFTCTFDPTIAAMISQVSSSRIWRLIAQLSGETNLMIGANSYTMSSRHTRYGAPLQKDAAFIHIWWCLRAR